ncbi:BrnT family toxin [candidate division KSB1 bacterium]|nr:BrnT family toxin [candidate division KSB1 bacterium]
MDIGFVWDERKYDSVKQKHKVQFFEVVAAFDDPNGYEVNDPTKHEDRWLWIGKTPCDRILAIIYSEQDLPLYRIITAFEAEGRWIDEYYKK